MVHVGLLNVGLKEKGLGFSNSFRIVNGRSKWRLCNPVVITSRGWCMPNTYCFSLKMLGRLVWWQGCLASFGNLVTSQVSGRLESFIWQKTVGLNKLLRSISLLC